MGWSTHQLEWGYAVLLRITLPEKSRSWVKVVT